MQNWQRGLTSAGLCRGDDIAAGKDCWNRSGLNRRRFRVVQPPHDRDEMRMQSQILSC